MGGRDALRRFAWFIGLWLAGVAAVAALAWLIRAAMGIA